MKTTDTKAAFIQLRAEGRSYNYIAKELGISKSTCSKWATNLQADIDKLKQEEIDELYKEYEITKEGRIKLLGDTLNKINRALEAADFTETDPAKLLNYQLKYTEALKQEYTAPPTMLDPKDIGPEDIMNAYIDLLNRARSGDADAEQVNKENTVLASILKTYQDTIAKNRIDFITGILDSIEEGA